MEHRVTQHDLVNGAKALFIDIPGARTVALEAVFRSGYAFADKSKYEVPHIAEHMMLSGTKDYPSAKEFKVEIEKNGAYKNASTGPFMNTYDFECNRDETIRIATIMASQLTSPLFPKVSFETEKSNVKEELNRNTSNYTRLSFINLRSLMMPNSVMPEDRRIKQLPQISLTDLRNHYSSTHTAGNMRIIVAGDLDGMEDELISVFNQISQKLPAGNRLQAPQEPLEAPGRPVVDAKPIKQIYYSLDTLIGEQLDDKLEVAAHVLSTLFKGRYDSWIYGEARERGLAYELGSSAWTSLVGSGQRLWAHVSPANSEELFKLFTKNWHRAITGDFTEQEVEDAKNYYYGRLVLTCNTPGRLINWYMNDFGIKDRLDSFGGYLEKLKQVSKPDIMAVTQKLTEQRRWGLSLVGDVDQKLADKLYKTVEPIWQA